MATPEVEAILFPGDSVTIQMQAAVHPDESDSWTNLQVRLAGLLPEDQDEPSTVISTRHNIVKTYIPVTLNKWYYARELGLSARNPEINLTFKHRELTREPFVVHGEIRSPLAAAPARTASFPINCAGFELRDIKDPANEEDDQIVGNNDSVFMTHLDDPDRPIPVMPRLVSRVYGLSDDFQVKWRFTSRYGRRGNRDLVRFPEEGWIQNPATQGWRVYSSYFGQFFGGDAHLEFEVLDSDGDRVYQGSRKFGIYADNPDDQASANYIRARSGEFWYAWAISQHESRQWRDVYNQFNSRGSRVKNEPNFGPPDGWGIFQIDSARGAEVTTREVWDWRENIFSGFDELKVAKQHSYDYMEAIKRLYPSQYEGYPPSYTPPNCETTLTWLETSILQLYNGASIVRKMPNQYGTRSYYRSCWKFYPGNPSGKRWKFIPNRNNYVYKVVKDEIEDRLGSGQ